MIKKLMFVWMAMGLTACTPEATVTAYHWNAFLKTPNEAHFKSLYADIKACNAVGCTQSEQITEEMINDLADLVRAKNHQALRPALASKNLLGKRAGVTYLAASYGPIIEEYPRDFLKAAVSENNSDVVNALTTSQGEIANYNGEYNELGMRRTRLSQVDDPALVNIRDTFVTAIDAKQRKIESGLIPRLAIPKPEHSY